MDSQYTERQAFLYGLACGLAGDKIRIFYDSVSYCNEYLEWVYERENGEVARDEAHLYANQIVALRRFNG